MENQKQLIRTATHEAGHIVARYLLYGNIDNIDYVELTIDNPEGRGNCYISKDYKNISYLENAYSSLDKFNEIFKYVCYTIAGIVAEKIHNGKKQLRLKKMVGDIYNLKREERLVRFGITTLDIKSNKYDTTQMDNLIKVAVDFTIKLLSSYKAKQLFSEIRNELLSDENIVADANSKYVVRRVSNQQLNNIIRGDE